MLTPSTRIRSAEFARLVTRTLACALLVVSCIGHGSTAAADGWWTGYGVPVGRADHAMAFDTTRGVFVLFGGRNAQGLLGDTWEWNGTSWSCRSTFGPTPRYGHDMAYDRARGVVVLFGGFDGVAYSEETWEWNGTAWMSRVQPGPAPRAWHAMAFDVSRSVVLLMGGLTSGGSPGTILGDTWEWNGSTWLQRTIDTPSVRYNHCMAYDEQRSVIVLFGGTNAPEQTWEWNGTAWSLRSSAGPFFTLRNAMAYDTLRARTVLAPGVDSSGQLGHAWLWDGATWSQTADNGYSPRFGHAMAFDSVRGVCTMFGGYTSITQVYKTDGLDWNGSTWTAHPPPTGPIFRSSSALAFDENRGEVVMFGGMNGTYYRDTWGWNGSVWSLRSNIGPSQRAGHAMAFDSNRGVVVLYGGSTSTTPNKETWEWDGSVWTLRETTGPTESISLSMAFDRARNRTVLFGSHQAPPKTWEWDGNSWTLVSTVGPQARYLSAMAYDEARGVTVLFGGRDAGALPVLYGDTWEWDGLVWTLRSTSGPAPRQQHAVAFDSRRGVVVLFGGLGLSPNPVGNETWEWSGTSWHMRASRGPTKRTSHAMAYDTARGQTVLFGGYTTTYNGETWLWSPSTVAPAVFIAVALGVDSSPEHVAACDLDNSGEVNGLDIQSYVSSLLAE